MMKSNQSNNLASWDVHLDKKYGKAGTPTRDKYEEEFENFKIGVLIQEARKPGSSRTSPRKNLLQNAEQLKTTFPE